MEHLQSTVASNKPIRNSSIELLRTIAMLMITFHHFSVHGGFLFSETDISLTKFWVNFISMGGKIGVDLFVLISGYFLILEKENFFNIKKILKLWGQIAFYSITITLIFSVFRNEPIGVKSFIKTLFPISFSGWWFASTYFVLYLIHPFLNRLLLGFDKATFQKYLVLLITCWCIIPTFTTLSYQGNALIWFVCLYSVSAYIRLFDLNPKLKRKHFLVLWIVFSALTYLSSVVFCFLGTKWSVFSSHATYFFGQDKLSVLLISLCLFMVFEKTELPYNKWINLIASATFGVYLIHDSNLVRPFLWIELFKNASYQNTPLLIPYSIFVVVLVYAVCTIIDLGRKYLLEKPFLKLVDTHADKWLLPFKKAVDWAKKIIFG